MGTNMKKIIISIIIILILLFFIGFLFNQPNYEQKPVKVGNTNFKIPEGYSEGKKNKFGDINLTKNNNSFFISVCNNSLSEQTKGMENYFKGVNETTKLTNLSMHGIVVYKLTITDSSESKLDDTKSSYYWFEKNNKVFKIYNWDGIRDMDNIVSNLVETSN